MQLEEEARIVQQVKNGNIEAFEALVKAYEKRVYNIALKMLGNPEDAEDAAQEAFIKAYMSIGTFRGDSRFSVWLYRLTNNCCIDLLRKRRDKMSLSVTGADGETVELDIPDERSGPEDEVIKKELRLSVREGLEKLPEEYRRILVLREIGAQSYAEIAEILDIDIGTVKSRIFRARKKLLELLRSDGNFFDVPASDYSEGRCAE